MPLIKSLRKAALQFYPIWGVTWKVRHAGQNLQNFWLEVINIFQFVEDYLKFDLEIKLEDNMFFFR